MVKAPRARASKPMSLRSAPSPVSVSLKGPGSVTAVQTSVAKTAVSMPPARVGEQRIYHVTHIDNLVQILDRGALLADSSDSTPVVDISSPENRATRRQTTVSADSEATVADYVPFFLSPNASVWNSIRAHNADPRLSEDAIDSSIFDYVILVSTVKSVIDSQAESTDVVDDDAAASSPSFTVTDGDAVIGHTRFAASRDEAERLLWTLRANPDAGTILESEFLVKDVLPFDRITLIGVANDKVRQGVRAILSPSGFATKVAVYPPWFQATDETAGLDD
ncbi:DUF4433 domain-containing protein [Leifsonia sp. A12D58]|uniref:DUF4433 domain-containing protein n=1 Tax=Leifsonia sp. A12D58 TaxID=3397674 RepID=UPI0039E010F1